MVFPETVLPQHAPRCRAQLAICDIGIVEP